MMSGTHVEFIDRNLEQEQPNWLVVHKWRIRFGTGRSESYVAGMCIKNVQ